MRNRVMLRLCILAMVAIALSCAPVRADVILQTEGTPAPSLSPILNYDVNFDNVATGALITPALFAAQGIASITNAGDPLYAIGGSQSLPNYVSTGPGDGWAGDITIKFGALQSVVGFGDAGPNTTTLSAFGALGNLLYTSTFSSASNDYWVLTDNTGTDIQSIEISSGFVAIDDVQFNNLASATPEPASVLLLGTGVLGLVVWRRRAAAARR